MTPELIGAIGEWFVIPALCAWFLYLMSKGGDE